MTELGDRHAPVSVIAMAEPRTPLASGSDDASTGIAQGPQSAI